MAALTTPVCILALRERGLGNVSERLSEDNLRLTAVGGSAPSCLLDTFKNLKISLLSVGRRHVVIAHVHSYPEEPSVVFRY